MSFEPMPQFPPRRLRILGQALLLTTDTTIYTVPTDVHAEIPPLHILVTNKSTAAHRVTLHAVPSGGAVGAATPILFNALLQREATLIFDGGVMLEAGARLVGLTDAVESVVAIVSGREFDQ